MDIKNVGQSKLFRGILIGILIMVLGIVIFQAGMVAGYRRAEFSQQVGQRYFRVFEAPKPGSPNAGFIGLNLPSEHGAAGEIVKLNLPTFVVASPDRTEKVVLLKDGTVIRRFRDTISSQDLKEGDDVIVLGTPDGQGEVVATFVRVMPKMSGSTTEPLQR